MEPTPDRTDPPEDAAAQERPDGAGQDPDQEPETDDSPGAAIVRDEPAPEPNEPG